MKLEDYLEHAVSEKLYKGSPETATSFAIRFSKNLLYMPIFFLSSQSTKTGFTRIFFFILILALGFQGLSTVETFFNVTYFSLDDSLFTNTGIPALNFVSTIAMMFVGAFIFIGFFIPIVFLYAYVVRPFTLVQQIIKEYRKSNLQFSHDTYVEAAKVLRKIKPITYKEAIEKYSKESIDILIIASAIGKGRNGKKLQRYVSIRSIEEDRDATLEDDES